MSARSGYEAGTPSWVDLTTTDPHSAMAFYRELFGWELDRGDAETSGYVMCRLGGRRVAGINGQPAPEGFSPAWFTYLASDDVDVTAERFTAAGGKVFMGPMDVVDQGRLLVGSDPLGAVIGFWEPREHRGAELIDEPGTLAWSELVTTDLDAAQAFYAQVCGHTFSAVGTGAGGPEYRTFQVGDRTAGGMLAMTGQYPEDVPPHWSPYFAVADVDESVARARRLGGSVQVEPTESPFGRWSLLSDPQGASLTLLTLPPGAAG